jgi:hypothetical protein
VSFELMVLLGIHRGRCAALDGSRYPRARRRNAQWEFMPGRALFGLIDANLGRGERGRGFFGAGNNVRQRESEHGPVRADKVCRRSKIAVNVQRSAAKQAGFSLARSTGARSARSGEKAANVSGYRRGVNSCPQGGGRVIDASREAISMAAALEFHALPSPPSAARGGGASAA